MGDGLRCFFFMLTAAQIKDVNFRYSRKYQMLKLITLLGEKVFIHQFRDALAGTDWVLEIYQCIVCCDSPNREQCTVLNWKMRRVIETHGAHHIKQYQLKRLISWFITLGQFSQIGLWGMREFSQCLLESHTSKCVPIHRHTHTQTQ